MQKNYINFLDLQLLKFGKELDLHYIMLGKLVKSLLLDFITELDLFQIEYLIFLKTLD